jgi:hypothetical protein
MYYFYSFALVTNGLSENQYILYGILGLVYPELYCVLMNRAGGRFSLEILPPCDYVDWQVTLHIWFLYNELSWLTFTILLSTPIVIGTGVNSVATIVPGY